MLVFNTWNGKIIGVQLIISSVLTQFSMSYRTFANEVQYDHLQLTDNYDDNILWI